MNLIVLDGLAPTIDYGNVPIVLAFETATLFIELFVVWYFMAMSGSDNRRMRYALCGSMVSNMVSFVIGAIAYTWLNGPSWLVTIWGGIYASPFDIGLFAALIGIFVVIGPIAILSMIMYYVFWLAYPDR